MDETTVRELLREVADVPGPGREMPVGIRRRARRRIAVTLGVTVVTAVALVAGSVAGVRSLMRLSESVPADRGVQREPIVAIPLDEAATQVVVGEGGVWVAGGEQGAVTRLDPATNGVVARFPGEYCTGMAIGEGAVWVSGPGEEIVRIDPASNEVSTVRRDAGAADCGSASRALFVEAGWVWVTKHFNTIERIDPRTYDVTTIDVPGEGTHSVAALDGTVWVDAWEEWEDKPGRLVGLDPATGDVVADIRVPVLGVDAGFGSLWAPSGQTDEPTRFLRIDPSTGSVVATVDLPPGMMEEIAVGENAVWVALPFERLVLRIDPATNQIVGEIHLETQPRGIAAGGGAVWVTDGLGTLYRIDPDQVVASS